MKKLYMGILICFAMFILVAGCVNQSNTSSDSPVVQPTQSCLIENAGNGTLVFNCVNAPFVKALFEYIGDHPSQTVAAIAVVPGIGSYNPPSGYIVVMKENK